MTNKKYDPVNNPGHYANTTIEPIQVIDDWGLGFCDGNVIKYIKRFKDKGTPLLDLQKAKWYLDYLIGKVEKENCMHERMTTDAVVWITGICPTCKKLAQAIMLDGRVHRRNLEENDDRGN